jgi:hypothetical protein
MEASAKQSPKARPWTHIWFSPAGVYRILVALRNLDFMHRLMVVWSVSATAVVMLPSWTDPFVDLHPMEPLIQMLVMAPFMGLIAGYVFGAALKSVGTLFKGQATNDVMRMVNAWSFLPVILSHIGCLVFYIASGNRSLLHPVNLGILAAGALWGIIIRHAGVKEAHKISTGQAILTQVLAFLLVMVPLAIISFVYFSVLKGAFKIE